MNKVAKPLPHFAGDQEAEDFVAEADLTSYDLSGAVPADYEFKSKDRTISMRVSKELLDAVKQRAAREGVPYQRFVRQALEAAIARGRP